MKRNRQIEKRAAQRVCIGEAHTFLAGIINVQKCMHIYGCVYVCRCSLGKLKSKQREYIQRVI